MRHRERDDPGSPVARLEHEAPERPRDACGIGFVADEMGRRTHAVLELALAALAGLDHRGAVAADGRSSDGTGVLLQIPRELLERELARRGSSRHDSAGPLGLAMVFLPREPAETAAALRAFDAGVARSGLEVLSWRPVPTRPDVLGPEAAATRPAIAQAILGVASDGSGDGAPPTDADFETRLFLARRRIENDVAEIGIELSIVSMSSRTVVYKSRARAADLASFYPDLRDPEVRTGVALFHQRFSTNTWPSWSLAQPFRLLAHNGEINTIRGNLNWMASREPELREVLARRGLADVLPVLDASGSDSAMLDQALEFLVRTGRDPLASLAMLIPEACPDASEDDGFRAFVQWHRTVLEPWDGPAAIVSTDGRIALALLDRNGLRPQRYWRTADGLTIVGSEAGLVAHQDVEVIERGRLGPGQMLAVDLSGTLSRPAEPRKRGFYRDAELKRILASRAPWRRWVDAAIERIPAEPHTGETLAEHESPPPGESDRSRAVLKTFGWSKEALDRILDPMMEGRVPVGSMGNDAPLAVLSEQPQLLYSYFKQRFAQVTNPPIDPIRERLVFDLEVFVGAWRDLLHADPAPEGPSPGTSSPLLRFPSPVVSPAQYALLRDRCERREEFRSAELSSTWPVAEGVDGMVAALVELEERALREVEQGAVVLFVTDRHAEDGVGPDRAPIPMLLAVSALHQRLLRAGARLRTSLVCDTAEPREDHHVACLVGFGATLVHPWLAYETTAARAVERGLDPDDSVRHYREALEKGLLKVLSRLGVCPMLSYHGAQLFEALGLDPEFVGRWFPGTVSRIAGVGPKVVAADVLRLHAEAWETDAESAPLPDRGYFRFRRGGETHDWEPRAFTALHKAVRGEDPEVFDRFSTLVDRGRPTRIRDLLGMKEAGEALPLDDVEGADRIARTFVTAAMSLGALSAEAHEVLAVGMNRLGARSNSGEGGEEPARYRPYGADALPVRAGRWQPRAGDRATSAIKQVASGRFGVTPEYLRSATEIEIKMAQGSKPGEGGQIPGHKVTVEIARLRRAVPGMRLVSPPPHHDIYSIEDLAQLIYDLKRVAPRARVGVKLVSVAGIGTIACGVVKAGADFVLVSGDDGGTGASPLSSIKHAGLPWELGLAETQRALVRAGLRERITLRVDGGLRTGRDIVLGALLGAEEFGFGTAPLLAVGCVMARQCHLDTCPVGIATQREDLRRRFAGTPEQVVAFMLFVAEQVRHHLSRIGLRSLSEAVGRFDLLESREERAPVQGLRLDRLIRPPEPTRHGPRRGRGARNELADETTCLDERVLRAALPSLESGRRGTWRFEIGHRDRSVGARLSGEIAERTGGAGFEEGHLRFDLRGVAGQSFGCFASRGVDLRLHGEAQDYVGKGLAGGRISILGPVEASSGRGEAVGDVLAGNTLLYGATSGSLFVAGRVGERLAVRNSGADAVVEGCGDHGCEYMTGGRVVVLGSVGRNFGAGMVGGLAWILDPARRCLGREDGASVEMMPLERIGAFAGSDRETEALRILIGIHLEMTGSARAREVLADWDRRVGGFLLVRPHGGREIEVATRAAEPDEAEAQRTLDG